MKKTAVWRHFLCSKAELRLDITLKCGESFIQKEIRYDSFDLLFNIHDHELKSFAFQDKVFDGSFFPSQFRPLFPRRHPTALFTLESCSRSSSFFPRTTIVSTTSVSTTATVRRRKNSSKTTSNCPQTSANYIRSGQTMIPSLRSCPQRIRV